MASVQELAGQLSSDDQAEAFRGYQALERLVYEAGRPGAQLQRSQTAAALAAELVAVNESPDGNGGTRRSPKYPPRVRRQLARLLTYLAGEAEVPALRTALEDFQVREMARWALDGTNTPAATALLIGAAQQAVGPEFLVGVVNALGNKSGADVVAELKRQCLNDDVEIRTAAAEALSRHPDASADSVLATVIRYGDATGRVRSRLLRARLQLGDTLVAAGQTDAGKAIYQSILAEAGDEPQAAAAKSALERLG